MKIERGKSYRNAVNKLTNQIAFLVPGIEKREFRVWDLDHKIPVDNVKKSQNLLFDVSILDQKDSIKAQLSDG